MSLYLDPLTHPDAWNYVIFKGVRTPGKATVSGWARANEYDVKVGKGTAGATETLKGQPPAKGKITFWAWTPAHFSAWNPILDILRFDPSKGGNAATAAPKAATGDSFTTGGASGSSVGGSGGGQAGTIPQPGAAGAPKASDGWPTNTSGNAQPSLSKAYAIDVFHPALADIGVDFVLPPESLGQWEEDGEGSGLYKREIDFLEFAQAKGNVATTPTGAEPIGNSFTTGGEPNNGSGTNGQAAPAGSGSAKGAGKDAQGSWGAP